MSTMPTIDDRMIALFRRTGKRRTARAHDRDANFDIIFKISLK